MRAYMARTRTEESLLTGGAIHHDIEGVGSSLYMPPTRGVAWSEWDITIVQPKRMNTALTV